MNQFKKLAKVFTTWKSSSKSSSESKLKQHMDDYSDAKRYLEERMLQHEYEKAIRMANSSILTANAANAAGQAAMWTTHTGQNSMGAVNQVWPAGAQHPMQAADLTHFSVEKVDNGFILRSGKYSKVCGSMDELKDLFVSIMVEKQLDK